MDKNLVHEEQVADLLAGFGSFKFIPMPIVFSTNNFNPKLVLYDDHISYRGGFWAREISYENIERIDVFFWGKRTNNLIVYKKKGWSTFIGNFKSRTQLQLFLFIFKMKGCQLTDKAQNELNTANTNAI